MSFNHLQYLTDLVCLVVLWLSPHRNEQECTYR